MSRLCTLAARRIIDISAKPPSHILASSFSDGQVYLHERMTIIQGGTPLDVTYAVDFNNQKCFLIGTPHVDSNPSIPSTELHSNVSIKRYKPTKDKQAQMSRHTEAQDENTSRLAQDWWHEAHPLDNYFAYHDKFVSLLAEF